MRGGVFTFNTAYDDLGSIPTPQLMYEQYP